jgi:O-acetyl-ADP-ribose deacetylase (regulator of RNase III)
MITYLDISLFESPAQTLVNTINTVGVMGKGIAAVFKRLYPDMFEKYRQMCLDKKLDIGKLYVYRTPNKIIVNFPTKKHWRNPSRVSYVEAGLKKFVATYQDYGISSVAFPQLGCGHGELDWDTQVQPLMEKYLRRLPIPVYIHIYDKSPDFVPERLDVEFAREIQMERRQVSVDQLWLDLQQLVSKSGSQYQLDMFATVQIDAESIFFVFEDERKTIYRQDIEDIWNTLRLRGTLRENNVPLSIIDAKVVSEFFELLKRLEYISPITLMTRRNGVLVPEQGLQYSPLPEVDIDLKNELVI